MATRNIGSKPRHKQYSTVHDLHVIPFGFGVSAAGAILAGGNANPPQLYAEAGANNQSYVLNCPKGNPDKIWAVMWSENDNTAAVVDYSTISDGTLAIALSAAPLGDTYIQGVLCYGGVSGEAKGVVATAPSRVRQLRSLAQFCTDSLLKELMVYPVGWTTDTNGDVTETRGPLGTTVTHSGVGEYTISFTHATPNDFEGIWAKLQGASDGRNAGFTYSTSGNETSVVMTFENSADMADGDRASVFFVGPVSDYPDNYGGASGGVYSNLTVRHVHNYRNYIQKGLVRGGVMIPFHADIAAGTAGPTEATSNLPPNMRIERTGAGVYALYVGSLVTGGLIAEAMNLSNGTAIGVTNVDESGGVLTLTAVGGVDPGACALNGFLFLKHQTEP